MTIDTQLHGELGYTAQDLTALGVSALRAFYTDPAFLERERERVFSQSWALVALSEELADIGDYVARTAHGFPIAVVRGRDGTLRALHNVCRHRGITLLEGTGSLGRFITCPYHQWSYELDGSLVRIPQHEEQFPGLDQCTLGLHDAQVAEWRGMVFVNPSPGAPTLSQSMCGLDLRLDGFLDGPLRQVAQVEYEAACNWKFLIENHIDVYHLWYLHSRSLAPYEHRLFRWESLGDNWWSLEPLKDPASKTDGLDWLGPDMRHHIGAFLLFPNLMLVTTDDYFATYDATPVSPDRTRLTLRVRAADDADSERLVESIRSFMAEDVEACERMQQGTASPQFQIGALAESHEEPVRRFHASLRKRLLR